MELYSGLNDCKIPGMLGDAAGRRLEHPKSATAAAAAAAVHIMQTLLALVPADSRSHLTQEQARLFNMQCILRFSFQCVKAPEAGEPDAVAAAFFEEDDIFDFTGSSNRVRCNGPSCGKTSSSSSYQDCVFRHGFFLCSDLYYNPHNLALLIKELPQRFPASCRKV
jgi:hypothetical protein